MSNNLTSTNMPNVTGNNPTANTSLKNQIVTEGETLVNINYNNYINDLVERFREMRKTLGRNA